MSISKHKLREQFETFALPHLESLFSTAVRMTHSHHDAEDLVQDTCLRAYRNFDQLRQPSRCRGWLFRILVHTYVNAYRRRERAPEMLPYEEEAHCDPGPSPEVAVFGRLVDDEITAALDSLPDDFRLAVVLVDLEGLSYQETAEAVGCPVGTVRSRLSRGRRLLAGLLRDVARVRGLLREGGDE